MTTRIESGGPPTGVIGGATAARVTAPPVRPFRQVVQAGSAAVINGAEAAVTHLPGGPVLAAAFRPGPPIAAEPAGIRRGATSPEGSAGTADSGSSTPNIEDVLADNADKNLYYLELQERISAESREYSALSNVLKARHDTIKNAIGNIR